MAPEEKSLHQLLQKIDDAEVFEHLVGSPICGETIREHLRSCRECEIKRCEFLQKKLEELSPEKRSRLEELGNQLAMKLAEK